MAKGDDDLGAIVGGILLGLGGLALYEALRPKCPICKAKLKRNETPCPSCGTWVMWQ